MSINLTLPRGSIESDLKPHITVIGVGGAGGNAVNNMIQSGLEGVEFLAINSDAQALALSKSERRIQMGINITQGLGAGANPDIGQAAAEESLEEIISHIKDANMVFITAGLGGGTGTGAAPVIARAAREYGILTVGVVTKPFQFEGANRMKAAEAGLEELQQYVDTLLIIPNQNLFRVANEKTTFADAFKMADDVLYSGVRGVTDLMVMPGLINLDFADIKSVMSEMGKAMMGTGEAEGERRATEAAEQAIANPLLDDTSMSGAKGVLINITAGTDITLFEVDEAANRIRDEVDGDVNIIFGSTFDESLEGRVRVSVVATGIESKSGSKQEPIIREITQEEDNNTIAAPELAKNDQESQNSKISQPSSAVSIATATSISTLSQPAEQVSIFEPINGESYNNIVPSKEEGVAKPATLSPKFSGGEDNFIPAKPANITETEMAPDPFAVADMINATNDPDTIQVPRKSNGLSLFERVTGVARGNKRRAIVKTPEVTCDNLTETITQPKTESISKVEVKTEEQPKLEPQITEVISSEPVAILKSEMSIKAISELSPEPAVGIIPEPAPESNENSIDQGVKEGGFAPQSLLGEVEHDASFSTTQDEDDVLDIPAFLRRQAN
jgi:cell division protein FtsZ